MSADSHSPLPLLEPSHVALALLRLAIRRFEAALTPRVKQWARETWGDEPQGVAAEERERLKTKHDYVPRWAQKCRECLSKEFARTFHSDYLDEWDAYRLGEVIQRHLDATASARLAATTPARLQPSCRRTARPPTTRCVLEKYPRHASS